MNNNALKKRWSVVTWLIIVTCFISIIGFVVMEYFPDKFSYFALNPLNIFSGRYLWTIVLHMFVHGSVAHLAINMFVLFSLGSLCEKIIGRKRFVWFYLIFAIAGLYVILLPRLRFMIIFLPFFSLPAYIMIPVVLFLTWVVSFFGNFPIGNVAHLGGFLIGLFYGLFLKSKYKRKVAMLQKIFK